MNTALSAALQRMSDNALASFGFDEANRRGLLGGYMEMMNRSGSGGYPRRHIVAAKMNPGVVPWEKAKRA